MTGFATVGLTLDQVRCAVSALGGTPRGRGSDRFAFSTDFCHGGNSPTGAWAAVKDGWVTLHCHRCPFPDSDRQIRERLGLPRWKPPRVSPEERPHRTQERTGVMESHQYHNPTTGETITQRIFRYPGICWREDCHDRGAHKHIAPKRDGDQLGTPINGFDLLFHGDESADLRIVIGEGESTAASASAVQGAVGVSWFGGANNADKADYRKVEGRDPLIAPDNDPAGELAAMVAARECWKAGANSVRIGPPVGESRGADLADVELPERVKWFQDTLAGALADGLSLLGLRIEERRLVNRCMAIDRKVNHRPLIEVTDEKELGEHLALVRQSFHHLNNRLANPVVFYHGGQDSALAVLAGATPDDVRRAQRASRGSGSMTLRVGDLIIRDVEKGPEINEVAGDAAYWWKKWDTVPLYRETLDGTPLRDDGEPAGDDDLDTLAERLARNPGHERGQVVRMLAKKGDCIEVSLVYPRRHHPMIYPLLRDVVWESQTPRCPC